jgi:tetraacyldisaccharide 4'-kinase
MLARRLEGVAVLVSSSRYLAGRLAEHHFGCTVHVLDDGFQHFALHRDADILVIARADLARPITLPSGRLREPIDAAAAADAIVMLDDPWLDDPAPDLDDDDEQAIGWRRPVWRARRRQETARLADAGTPFTPSSGPVVAVAGIAQPAGFFRDLEGAGWTIARELPYPDHYRYTGADVARIVEAARASGALAVVTTEKDLVRLLPFRPFAVPLAYVPMTLEIDPPGALDAWLVQTLEAARGRGPRPRTPAAEHAEHAEHGPRNTAAEHAEHTEHAPRNTAAEHAEYADGGARNTAAEHAPRNTAAEHAEYADGGPRNTRNTREGGARNTRNTRTGKMIDE